MFVRALRANAPLLVSGYRSEAGGEWAADGPFFRLEPSEHSNGCFLAVLNREVSHTHTHTVHLAAVHTIAVIASHATHLELLHTSEHQLPLKTLLEREAHRLSISSLSSVR